MSNREEKDIELFDRIAHKYAEKDVYAPSAYARQFQTFSLFNQIAKTHGNHFNLMVDVGCGVGATSSYLNQWFNKYVGLDYSESFIKLAKERYGNEKVDFQTKNLKEADFGGITPDLVFGVGVLHHVTDYESIFSALKTIGNKETIYGFIEPQSGNPLVQFMRWIRKQSDDEYSEEQIFFGKNQIKNIFEQHGFEVIEVKNQGYFTPPFAQVMLKPKSIFMPLSKLAVWLDKGLQRINFPLAWNLTIYAKLKQ